MRAPPDPRPDTRFIAPVPELAYPWGMSETTADFSDVCTACGLCCDGTMFGYAPLEPDELEQAAAAGFDLKDFGGKPGFAQPCRQLCGTSCGIYLDRPQVCRGFRCATLRQLDDGQIDPAEAARRVADVRAAVAQLRPELLPGETIVASKERLKDALENKATVSPRFKLMLGVLELLLDRHFRKPSLRVFTGMSS